MHDADGIELAGHSTVDTLAPDEGRGFILLNCHSVVILNSMGG